MADAKPDYYIMLDLRQCPQDADHDPEVRFGIEGMTFSQWAREKARTHRPVRCQGCGLFRIWELRPVGW